MDEAAAGRPSVVHVLAPADFGGLESVVVSLARSQMEAGQRVTIVPVIGEHRERHPFVDTLTASGVHTRVLRLRSTAYREERRAIRDLLREVRADVLHTHGYRSDVLDSGVAASLGVATVSTVHGFTGFGWKGKVYEWVQRRWLRRFDAVVVVSDLLRAELARSGVPERRLHVIQNAWQAAEPPLERAEARTALGLDPVAPVVGWVGRLSPEKGPDLAIRVLEALKTPDVRLSVVGGGPMEHDLRLDVERRGLTSRVRWHGVVPGAGRYLGAFDAVLMSSRTEGTPMSLLEAMSAGTPVVTTSVGGIPDVVSESEAVLAPAGDVAALARGLDAVFDAPSEAAGRADAARRRLADVFAVEPWARRYRDLYESVVRDRSKT